MAEEENPTSEAPELEEKEDHNSDEEEDESNSASSNSESDDSEDDDDDANDMKDFLVDEKEMDEPVSRPLFFGRQSNASSSDDDSDESLKSADEDDFELLNEFDEDSGKKRIRSEDSDDEMKPLKRVKRGDNKKSTQRNDMWDEEYDEEEQQDEDGIRRTQQALDFMFDGDNGLTDEQSLILSEMFGDFETLRLLIRNEHPLDAMRKEGLLAEDQVQQQTGTSEDSDELKKDFLTSYDEMIKLIDAPERLYFHFKDRATELRPAPEATADGIPISRTSKIRVSSLESSLFVNCESAWILNRLKSEGWAFTKLDEAELGVKEILKFVGVYFYEPSYIAWHQIHTLEESLSLNSMTSRRSGGLLLSSTEQCSDIVWRVVELDTEFNKLIKQLSTVHLRHNTYIEYLDLKRDIKLRKAMHAVELDINALGISDEDKDEYLERTRRGALAGTESKIDPAVSSFWDIISAFETNPSVVTNFNEHFIRDAHAYLDFSLPSSFDASDEHEPVLKEKLKILSQPSKLLTGRTTASVSRAKRRGWESVWEGALTLKPAHLLENIRQKMKKMQIASSNESLFIPRYIPIKSVDLEKLIPGYVSTNEEDDLFDDSTNKVIEMSEEQKMNEFFSKTIASFSSMMSSYARSTFIEVEVARITALPEIRDFIRSSIHQTLRISVEPTAKGNDSTLRSNPHELSFKIFLVRNWIPQMFKQDVMDLNMLIQEQRNQYVSKMKATPDDEPSLLSERRIRTQIESTYNYTRWVFLAAVHAEECGLAKIIIEPNEQAYRRLVDDILSCFLYCEPNGMAPVNPLNDLRKEIIEKTIKVFVADAQLHCRQDLIAAASASVADICRRLLEASIDRAPYGSNAVKDLDPMLQKSLDEFEGALSEDEIDADDEIDDNDKSRDVEASRVAADDDSEDEADEHHNMSSSSRRALGRRNSRRDATDKLTAKISESQPISPPRVLACYAEEISGGVRVHCVLLKSSGDFGLARSYDAIMSNAPKEASGSTSFEDEKKSQMARIAALVRCGRPHVIVCGVGGELGEKLQSTMRQVVSIAAEKLGRSKEILARLRQKSAIEGGDSLLRARIASLEQRISSAEPYVGLVPSEEGRIFAFDDVRTKYLKLQGLSTGACVAVGLGRNFQDPLAFVASLWSEFPQMNKVSALPLHPLQSFVPKCMLDAQLQRAIMTVAARAGADLGLVFESSSSLVSGTSASPGTILDILQFIPGLGPRKARHLVQLLEQQGRSAFARLALVEHMGKVVMLNCGPFLRYGTAAIHRKLSKGVTLHSDEDLYDSKGRLDTVVDVLDETRICWEPDVYQIVKAIAKAAMDIPQEENTAEAIPSVIMNPSLLDDIDLDGLAQVIQRRNRAPGIHKYLQFICNELEMPFKEFRVPFAWMSCDELFYARAGETFWTFGEMLSCTATVVFDPPKKMPSTNPDGSPFTQEQQQMFLMQQSNSNPTRARLQLNPSNLLVFVDQSDFQDFLDVQAQRQGFRNQVEMAQALRDAEAAGHRGGANIRPEHISLLKRGVKANEPQTGLTVQVLVRFVHFERRQVRVVCHKSRLRSLLGEAYFRLHLPTLEGFLQKEEIEYLIDDYCSAVVKPFLSPNELRRHLEHQQNKNKNNNNRNSNNITNNNSGFNNTHPNSQFGGMFNNNNLGSGSSNNNAGAGMINSNTNNNALNKAKPAASINVFKQSGRFNTTGAVK